jgi:hypothetical protein
VEANARIGPIGISGEFGYWFTNKDVSNSWIRGVIVGHEFRKKTEFYLEVYDQEATRGLAINLKLVNQHSASFVALRLHGMDRSGSSGWSAAAL